MAQSGRASVELGGAKGEQGSEVGKTGSPPIASAPHCARWGEWDSPLAMGFLGESENREQEGRQSCPANYKLVVSKLYCLYSPNK